MNTSLLHLTNQTLKTKHAFEGLRDYADTLERLLVAETARLLTHETLSDISARSREPSLDPSEPSDELVALRDSFPTILRGSLLPYIHGNFERFAREIANLFLSEPGLKKCANANDITTKINLAWPGMINSAAAEQLSDYKHLRNMCAHTAGNVGTALFEPKKVAKAAERTTGASFMPYTALGASSPPLTPAQRWSGYIEFDASFLPAAIEFHLAQLEAIAAGVVSPQKTAA